MIASSTILNNTDTQKKHSKSSLSVVEIHYKKYALVYPLQTHGWEFSQQSFKSLSCFT